MKITLQNRYPYTYLHRVQRRVILTASDPRVKTRGYRYYTPLGYGTEIPADGKYRAHLVNPQKKEKKD